MSLMLLMCCCCCHRYAADVADLIAGGTCGQVAGFIAETIQGVGGTTPLAEGYLPEVYKVCDAGCSPSCTAGHTLML